MQANGKSSNDDGEKGKNLTVLRSQFEEAVRAYKNKNNSGNLTETKELIKAYLHFRKQLDDLQPVAEQFDDGEIEASHDGRSWTQDEMVDEVDKAMQAFLDACADYVSKGSSA